MHTLKLLLDTTKADEVFISSVFDAIAKVHNILVAEGKKRLRMLKRDKRYKYAREHYGEAAAAAAKLDKKLQSLQKKLDDEKNVDKAAARKLKQQIKEIRSEWREAEAVRKQYAAELNECLEFYGASKKDMESFATQFLNPKFKGILGSQQIQVEADRVWFGMEKVFFGDGRDIHYKKYRDIRTIRGKQNTTGIRFIKDILSVFWNGHTIPVVCKKRLDKAAVDGVKNKDTAYKLESLSGDTRYCEIVREEFMDGYHYYANLYIDGDAPKKLTPGTGRCGIDPGVSSMAAVSEKNLFLEELAPEYKKYDKGIFKLQQKADRIRRELNPQNYAEDGTIIKRKPGQKRIWHSSPAYESIMQRIRILYRKKAAYIRQSHSILCSRLIQSADTFLIEDMDFKALAKRASETRRADKKSVVTAADGIKKEVYKYKRKKRFGKSIASRAPALILQILSMKCTQYGLAYLTTDTRKMKASQYDHTSDACTKHTLKDRMLVLSDGTIVQRDLYSAYLHQHADASLEHPDREACIRDFSAFMSMHDALIRQMKADGTSMKQCFGF